jgi:hypothetical protein
VSIQEKKENVRRIHISMLYVVCMLFSGVCIGSLINREDGVCSSKLEKKLGNPSILCMQPSQYLNETEENMCF